MSNLVAHVQGQGAGYRVGGMYPTIEVEDIIWDVVGVNAVNGVSHILARSNDHREGEKNHRADTPM